MGVALYSPATALAAGNEPVLVQQLLTEQKNEC